MTNLSEANVLCFLAGIIVMRLVQALKTNKKSSRHQNNIIRADTLTTSDCIPDSASKVSRCPVPPPVERKAIFVKRTPLINGIEMEEHYYNGLRHNSDGPAIIHRDRAGIAMWEEYFRHGERHRLDGPAVWFIDGTGWREEYWQNGKKHRADGPAVRLEKVDGSHREEYWLDGKLLDYSQVRKICAIDDPIYLQARPTNGVFTSDVGDGAKQEAHYLNGKLHSDSGPARTVTALDGTKWEEHWQHGKLVSSARRSGME